MNYEVEVITNNRYKAFVYNSILCQRLNRSLKVYPKEVDFVAEGSEGIFKFTQEQYKHVMAILNSI